MQISDWETLHNFSYERLVRAAFSVRPKIPRDFAVRHGGMWFNKYGGRSGQAKLLDKDQDGVDNAEYSMSPIGYYFGELEHRNPRFGAVLEIVKNPPQTPYETFYKISKELRYVGLTRNLHKEAIVEAARKFPLAKNILVWKEDMLKMDYRFLHNSLSMIDFAQEVARERLGISAENVCGSPIEFDESGMFVEMRPSEKVYARDHYVARRGNIFARRGIEIFVTDDIRPLWDGIVSSTLSPRSRLIATLLVKRWPDPVKDLVVKMPHARQDMTQLTYSARLSELVYLVSITTDPKAELQKTVRSKILYDSLESFLTLSPETFEVKKREIVYRTREFVEDYYLFVDLGKIRQNISRLERTKSFYSAKEYVWEIMDSLGKTVFEISLDRDWLKDVIEKWDAGFPNRNWWD